MYPFWIYHLGWTGTNRTHPLILRTHYFDRLRIDGTDWNDGRVVVQGSLYVEGSLNCKSLLGEQKWLQCYAGEAGWGLWGRETSLPSSDIRFKTNLHPIANALDKVMQLNGTYYRWNETGLQHFTQNIQTTLSARPDATEEEKQKIWDEERQKAYQALSGDKIGLIAQNVETVVPEVVHEDEEGYKSVDYQHLTALLVEAIKDQHKIIERLETRLSALESPTQ